MNAQNNSRRLGLGLALAAVILVILLIRHSGFTTTANLGNNVTLSSDIVMRVNSDKDGTAIKLVGSHPGNGLLTNSGSAPVTVGFLTTFFDKDGVERIGHQETITLAPKGENKVELRARMKNVLVVLNDQK